MADYSYPNGRFAGMGRDRADFRSQSWSIDNNGIETRDRWNTNTSPMPSKYQARHDDVCKPVIIGSDGKAPAVVLECPPHHGSVTSGFPSGGGNSRWNQSGDTYRADPYKAIPTVLECPPHLHKDGGGNIDRWDQSRDTNRADAYKAQEFISSVQTAASDGTTRLGHTGSMFQRQKAVYGNYDGDAYNKSSNGWGRAVTTAEPTMTNNGGWSRAGWGVPPEGRLSRPTNDIGTAAEFLRESASPASAAMAGPNFWRSQSPNTHQYQPKKKSSTTVIDSREAAEKYGGQFIW